MRSTKSDLVKALRDNTATKNASLSKEQHYQSKIATMTKLERKKMIAKDDIHEFDLEKKNNKTRVSASIAIIALISSISSQNSCQTLVKMNEKQKQKDANSHNKLQVLKDKKYSRMLATKDIKHSKLVSELRKDFTDELRKSGAKLDATAKQYHNLKRGYNAVLDDIKIKHRSSLRKQQMIHAQQITRKNKIVKRMWQDVEGTHEM
jgi:hypothetical protein